MTKNPTYRHACTVKSIPHIRIAPIGHQILLSLRALILSKLTPAHADAPNKMHFIYRCIPQSRYPQGRRGQH